MFHIILVYFYRWGFGLWHKGLQQQEKSIRKRESESKNLIRN